MALIVEDADNMKSSTEVYPSKNSRYNSGVKSTYPMSKC